MIDARITRLVTCLLSAAAGAGCVPLQLAGVVAGLASPSRGDAAGSVPVVDARVAAPPAMELYVSKEANFAVGRPAGWEVAEQSGNGQQYLRVVEPTGAARVEVLYGRWDARGGAQQVVSQLLTSLRSRSGDVRVDEVEASADGSRVAVNLAYTDPQLGPRRGRAWASTQGGRLFFATCDADAASYDAHREAMLSVVANVRPLRGAVLEVEAAPRVLPLHRYRLADGSASFGLPQGWTCQEMGRTRFWCSDPATGSSFGVANAEVITPVLGVRVPGVPVATYMAPQEALPFLAEEGGLARDFSYEQVVDRSDLAGEMARVYTAGPVMSQELTYTCTGADGQRVKGFTLGISFGSHLGASWSFAHLTVTAPVDQFDRLAPTFAEMLLSYQIDQAWARSYVEAGARRLAEMTRQTSRMIARNHAEITQMITDVYENRARSQEYIDYQFSTYMRGESDWISGTEGGKVYHSDSWGLTDTTSGDFWQDKPWDYVSFEGQNPRYNEGMEQVTTRDQWERAFGR